MKKWLRGGDSSEEDRPLTVDELVSLGRLEDAKNELELRLRQSFRDPRLEVKLGDVLLLMERPIEALEKYESAAQGLASEGFHDHAKAVLQKMLKIAPEHEKAIAGLKQLDHAKEIERRRVAVARELKKPRPGGRKGVDSFRVDQLWKDLSKSPLIQLLEPEPLARLFAQFTLRTVEAEAQIANRGDTKEELCLVAQGRVEVVEKKASGKHLVLRSYELGDVFGESTLLEHKEWLAVHVAAQRTKLLVLDPVGLSAALPGMEDPRGFLDALRQQRHDGSLEAMLRTTLEP